MVVAINHECIELTMEFYDISCNYGLDSMTVKALFSMQL